jgi:hypothetical protein
MSAAVLVRARVSAQQVLSDSDKTLGELGLAPQMALIVEPK